MSRTSLRRLFPSFVSRSRRRLDQRRETIPARPVLGVAELEDRSVPATLAITSGTLTYAQTSNIGHELNISFSAGTPGSFQVTDNEPFTAVPAGWTGVGMRTASGPATGITAVSVTTGSGNDTVNVASGTLPLSVNTGSGNDLFNVGRGKGTFALQAPIDLGGSKDPFASAVGDFNGDGKHDLAIANYMSASVSILLGNGDGTFAPQPPADGGVTPSTVAVGDFNGDGKQDIVTANTDVHTVTVVLGNGDGTFAAPTAFTTGTAPAGRNPGAAMVGDFNGDGKQDIVTANLNSDDMSVLLGNGNGTFAAPIITPGGNSPFAVAVGDFNGDGKQDIAVANFYGSNVSVRLGNGDGTFGAASNLAAGSYPLAVCVADFNGDGKQDFASTNINGGGGVAVRLGNGNGTFGSVINSPTVGTVPISLATGDFNGDGRPDLVTANYSGNSVNFLLGSGTGTFTTAPQTVVGTNPHAVVAADFNGDGRPDVAVPNFASGNMHVLLGSPGTLAGLTGAVTVDGGTGTNSLRVSEAGSTTANSVSVTSTQVAGAAVPFTVNYANQGVVNVATGTASDTITVTPSATTVINVDGNAPTVAPGDTLVYNGPGTVTPTGTGAGNVTQAGFAVVNYVGIETPPVGAPNPDVTLAVAPSSVLEDGATNLVYTFTRTGATTGSLTVNFSVGGAAAFGTDYTQAGAATFTTTAGTVTFAAGSSTATVTVDPTADTTVEPDEGVVLTLTSGTGYNVASPSAATGTITNDDTGSAPTLTGVLVNGTAAPSASLTNSRVTSLVLNFSTAVNLAPGAFSLTNGTSTITSNTGGAISTAGAGTNTITLTFTGSSGVDFTSLADGIWTLSTNMTLVTAVSGGIPGTGTTTTNNIRRLYGDIDGNGVVNSDDFDQFGNTFGLGLGEPGYLAGFDFDNNGVINSDDFDQFGNRFGIAL